MINGSWVEALILGGWVSASQRFRGGSVDQRFVGGFVDLHNLGSISLNINASGGVPLINGSWVVSLIYTTLVNIEISLSKSVSGIVS